MNKLRSQVVDATNHVKSLKTESERFSEIEENLI